jgi:hypothetical protein
VVPDCANWYFTSNHLTAFFLEDTDRRMFINATPTTTLSEKFYLDYLVWMRGKGPSHLLEYLLSVDLGGFNPHAPALMTMSKKRMSAAGRSEVASWISSIKEDQDNLRVGSIKLIGDLFGFAQLFEAYQGHLEENGVPRDGKITLSGFTRQLQMAGIAVLNNGANLKVGSEKPMKYFAINNQEKWLEASQVEIEKHISGQKPTSAKQKKF